MKKSLFVCFAAALLLACGAAFGQTSRTRQPADARKVSDTQAGTVNIDVNVGFSGQSGVTITDENGTFYNCMGWSFFEPKVYPPEYWGVFPLYFFGDVVGVSLTVTNLDASTQADVRLRRECYCLRTDGSSGGALAVPAQNDVAVAPSQTAFLDGSFAVDYWADSEDGLDRFLTKVYLPTTVDANNGVHVVSGAINVNPNNSTDNEFVLRIPGGRVITRDDLASSYEGYTGPAVSVHLKPKGNGNQNGLVVDGQTYSLKNGDTYDFVSESMTLSLQQANGHWWINMNATAVTILVDSLNNEPIMVKEAVFCPPEYDAAVVETVRSALGR